MNIQAHSPLCMAYANERDGTFMHILTCFLRFLKYFICKIVKGVRKVSSPDIKGIQNYPITFY